MFDPNVITKMINTFKSSAFAYEGFIEKNKDDFYEGELIEVLFGSKGLKVLHKRKGEDRILANVIQWEEFLGYLDDKLDDSKESKDEK